MQNYIGSNYSRYYDYKNKLYNPNFNPYTSSCDEVIMCESYDAYVPCITNILQGTFGCISLKITNGNQFANLENAKINILITNSLGYFVAEINDDNVNIVDGDYAFSLNPEQTYTVPGYLHAQITITTNDNNLCNTYVIGCTIIANIVKDVRNGLCFVENE